MVSSVTHNSALLVLIPSHKRFLGDAPSPIRPGLREKLRASIQPPRAIAETEDFARGLALENPAEVGEVGFGFSAGGLLFPYFIGVTSCLHEYGIISRDTKMAGSSAGALISAFYHAGMSSEELMEGCLRVSEDCRMYGTRGRLRSVLEKVIRNLLPEDAHFQCTGKSFVAITRLYPFGNTLLSEFESREDLIQALLASCHVPVWFDSTFLTDYKNALCMDGGLTNLIPTPPVARPIRISCFPTRGWGDQYKVKIAPDRYRQSKYDVQQLLGLALEPGSEDKLFELFSLGQRDALDYIDRYTVPSMYEDSFRDILLDDEDIPIRVKSNIWAKMRKIIFL